MPPTDPTPSSSPRAHPRRRLAWRLLAILGLWMIVHTAVLVAVGMHQDLRCSDCAMVLGNGLDSDGGPNPTLRGRLDRTLSLYRQGLFGHLIVSGATAADGYNEPRAMRRYLAAGGVPQDCILEDPGGHNTMLSAVNTRVLMTRYRWHNVLVISDYYHLLRARLAMARAGVQDVRMAHSDLKPGLPQVRAVLREFVAFYWYLIRPIPD